MTSSPEPEHYTVLVYSQNPTVRLDVIMAVGRRPAQDFPPLRYVECATEPEVIAAVDAGGIDLAILDGEAQPTGGMGISRQLKNEIANCPLMCVLLGRRDDRWLATWSLADATISFPLDPVTTVQTVVDVLRTQGAMTQ